MNFNPRKIATILTLLILIGNIIILFTIAPNSRGNNIYKTEKDSNLDNSSESKKIDLEYSLSVTKGCLEGVIAIDSKDNLHIAYVKTNHKDSDEFWPDSDIFYIMLDSKGNTLIKEKRLTRDTNTELVNSIIIRSNDKPVVFWQKNSVAFYSFIDSWNENFIIKFNNVPLIDYKNPSITSDPESNGTFYSGKRGYNLKSHIIDSNSNIYVIITKKESNKNITFLKKFDKNSQLIFDNKQINFGNFSPSLYDSPPIKMVVDSENNIHLAWTFFYREYPFESNIYYSKVNESGDILIPPKKLYDPYGKDHGFLHDIIIDSEDNVHIMWAHKPEENQLQSDLWSYKKLDKNGNELKNMSLKHVTPHFNMTYSIIKDGDKYLSFSSNWAVNSKNEIYNLDIDEDKIYLRSTSVLIPESEDNDNEICYFLLIMIFMIMLITVIFSKRKPR